MRYIPNTAGQRAEMLEDIGIGSVEELFSGIPHSLRLNRSLQLPDALSEIELMAHMRELAGKNADADGYTCFLGAGAYDHYIPSVVKHLTSRQEFYTAYTPYQPEISQGTLQAIFEYQTMIKELTGMEVANASMYDGATAAAEAAAMACGATKRNGILAAYSVHPETREVLKTYSRFRGTTLNIFGYKDGRIDRDDLEAKLTGDTAAVIIQTPNFFGIVEDYAGLAELLHKRGTLLIVICDPISLAIFKSPGELGADIAVGDGQCLGNAMNFGGPSLGFFATTAQLMRKMPGRIVGETTDKNGKRGFVLTLQTREQHIRREKATSNICSNQALNALNATIYLSVMGKEGLKKVALLCAGKAAYAREKLMETGYFKPVFNAPVFKEFILEYKGNVGGLNEKLMKEKIIGGLEAGLFYKELENTWLVAVTEKRSRKEIDILAGKVGL